MITTACLKQPLARRTRRLARKKGPKPDYFLEAETPDEWRSEMDSYFTYFEDEPASDWPLIRSTIERLIEACPHEDAKLWAQGKLEGQQQGV